MATAKKPTAAQLAARKRFAEMARAGVFTGARKKRSKNPVKKRAAKPVTRPSQASGKKPTKRLVARRVATKKAPAGFFANPKKRTLGGSHVYQVQYSKDKKAWAVWSTYLYAAMAKDVAARLADDPAHSRHYIRVESIPVKAK